MKLYLLDLNRHMTEAWEKTFHYKNVEIVTSDFQVFVREYKPDAIVAPGNSFGIMDGGLDREIRNYLGMEAQEKLQRKIKTDWYGELPPGTVTTVKVGVKYIVYTPTMRIPGVITDKIIIYNCMRSSLIELKRLGIQTAMIPAFGGATGAVMYEEIAKCMRYAYEQIFLNQTAPLITILEQLSYNEEEVEAWIRQMGRKQGVKEKCHEVEARIQ